MKIELTKRNVIIIASVLAGLIVLFAAVYLYRMSSRNAVDVLVQKKKLINILVAGSGSYRENRHRFYCLLTINPHDGNTGVTFIPPSYRVSLDSRGSRTCRLDEYDLDGFDRLSSSLGRDMGLSIPFYVILYSPDVRRIVDLMEGMDLFMLDQNGAVRQEDSTENVPFGFTYHDGGKILKYINEVQDNSIYLKYDRIQDILLTLFYDRENRKKYVTPLWITELMKTVKTNLLPQEIYSLARIMVENGNMYTTQLPGSVEGNFYVMDEIARKIYENDFLNPIILGKEPEANIKIRVLNGTDVPGLARKVRNILIREGLTVLEFSTSPYGRIDKSLIVCRKGNYSMARRVAELTGIERICFITDTTQVSNLLIIVGEDLVR